MGAAAACSSRHTCNMPCSMTTQPQQQTLPRSCVWRPNCEVRSKARRAICRATLQPKPYLIAVDVVAAFSGRGCGATDRPFSACCAAQQYQLLLRRSAVVLDGLDVISEGLQGTTLYDKYR